MTSTVEALNGSQQLAAVRLVAASNQSGTYYNGPLNNGVQATFTYATGALTIDSVVANVNDYILLAGQSLAYENGVYQVTTAGATGVAAVLQRRGDFQCIEQIRVGHYVPVGAGTVYGGSMWTVIEPKPAAIGVPVVSGANNIEFATITASGSGLFLEVANNLSDVASATTSATNLGLGTGNTPTFAGVNAGSSGSAGQFNSFPATAANGELILKATNAGGAFNTTISNGTMGQSTVYTLPDIGATTGDIVVSTSAVRLKSVHAAAAAGGAAAQSFTDAFCTTTSVVIGNWVTQANAEEVVTIVPGAGSFVVTSTGDAGAGTFSYVIMK